jgi:hypothetical protein
VPPDTSHDHGGHIRLAFNVEDGSQGLNAQRQVPNAPAHMSMDMTPRLHPLDGEVGGIAR